MNTRNFHEFDIVDSDQWQNYLNRLNPGDKDIYFAPGYYQLYDELGDGSAKCFVFEEGENIALYPFLKNRINDLGYDLEDSYFDIQGTYGYNGTLYSSLEPTFVANFNDAFSQYCKENNIVAEFTRFHPLLKNKEFSVNRMTVINDRETVYIDLSASLEEIWENEYSSKNRNMIRKAIKIGYAIEVVEHPSLSELTCFIKVYSKNMQMANADAYFYFNEAYFLNTFKYLGEYSYLFNVKDVEGNVVCSAIFFKYDNYFHYHLAGRLESADNSVNNFLISEAVKFAKDSGAKFIHLGGGRSNAIDDSLLKFKKSFSKSTLDFSIGKKIHNQAVYNLIESQWIEKNQLIKDQYKNFLLKYRI